jgi:hypothetical protein
MMNLTQAQALARMEETQPDYTRTVLCDSGYGDLAEQWLDAASAFETATDETQRSGADKVSQHTMRAYARMCVSWSRISQLREQAMGRIERLTRPG